MKRRSFIKGNDAIIAGALSAGCRAFFGYPITPASEIAHDAMRLFPEADALAIQAESEVAAIHMLYGAGATGTPAMTATSGPGLSLMQDGLSYMAAARLPGVVVDIMRAGPGLGNIAPEQSDFNTAVYGGGHGDYHMPVLAPYSVQEMFDMTQKAFEIAFRFKTPVCLLADAFIGQMMETLLLPTDLPQIHSIPQSTYPMLNRVDGTPRTAGNVISTLELDPQKLEKKNDARFEAYQDMHTIAEVQWLESALVPHESNDADNPSPIDVLIIAFGICARIAEEAFHALESHCAIALLRPKLLWPIDEEQWCHQLKRAKKILVVECNRGMMRACVERLTDKDHIFALNRDGGCVPSLDEVIQKIQELRTQP